MLRNGTERGLIARGSALVDPLPAITYADVADGLPFADGRFDIVYSQASSPSSAVLASVSLKYAAQPRSTGLSSAMVWVRLRPRAPLSTSRMRVSSRW